MSESEAFMLKYRPQTLDAVIGHETAVTRLKGMVSSNKFSNALLFLGPTSVGKTTLARALAVAINGKPIDQQKQSYTEVNASDKRTIEDVRDIVQLSKYKASGAKRIIVVDECQGIASNAPAAACFLKPLEEPSPNLLWILCSMEPSKFQSGNGKAIAGRCTQFILEPHTNADLYKQAVRIAKGEQMRYIDKDMLKEIVKSSGNMMRSLASIMQGVRDYYEGLDKKPKMLSMDNISSVLASTESNDDKLAVKVIASVFAGKYAEVQRSLLNVGDGYQFISKLLWLSSFILNHTVLQGSRHPKVWYTPSNKELLASIKSNPPTLGMCAALQASLVELKSKAQSFAVGEIELISATMYHTIKNIHSKEK